MFRRSFLTSIGGAAAATSLASAASANDATFDTDPKLPGGPGNPATRKKRHEYLSEAYGPGEASIAQGIASKYRGAIQSGRLTPDEAYDRTVDELLEHPRVEAMAEDIQRQQRLDAGRELDPDREVAGSSESDRLTSADSISASTEGSLSTSAVGDTASVSIAYGEMGKSGWGVSASSQSLSVSDRRMSTNARITAIGGATSYTRLYGRITPSSSIGGATRITANYYRLGNVVGGDAGVFLWARETARPETIVRQRVESPGRTNGTTTRNAQLTLPAGVRHDVGIELRTAVNSIVAAYFYADYYFQDLTSQRRLVLKDSLRVESLD